MITAEKVLRIPVILFTGAPHEPQYFKVNLTSNIALRFSFNSFNLTQWVIGRKLTLINESNVYEVYYEQTSISVMSSIC